MADTDPPETGPASTPAKPARRRSTTPAKARAAKPSAPTAQAEAATPAAAKAKAPPKPRTTKRAVANLASTRKPAPSATKPAPSARKPAARAKASLESAAQKAGVPWGVTAIGAGIVVAGGVAAAALLSLRGSSSKPKPAAGKGTSHQADGTDSSDQFEAGIADEGMVPE